MRDINVLDCKVSQEVLQAIALMLNTDHEKGHVEHRT
jgi:hypothetical protein